MTTLSHQVWNAAAEIVGTDDLSVAADGVYYFLGDDATNGTTLAGIDLETGDVICQAAVPFINGHPRSKTEALTSVKSHGATAKDL